MPQFLRGDSLAEEPPSDISAIGVTQPVLSESVESAIASSADRARVRSYFDQFQDRNPQAFEQLATDSERVRWLATIFDSSRFLSEEVLKHPEWVLSLWEIHTTLSVSDYANELDAFARERRSDRLTAADFALFRRKQLLRIVLRDQLETGTLAAVTEELSNLADLLIASALQIATEDLELKFGVPIEDNEEGEKKPAALTVLALGKLGGRELNYSSDIDLMFLYSANGETSGPQRITNKEFFKRVANELTKLLSSYTAAGQCYRLDLRLRPEGSHGEVCVSLAAAKQYYATRARNWELQMLLKARVAAGDRRTGQEFLEAVEPLIYSTAVDFSTIETMSVTRERIGAKIASKPIRPAELDVKLTRGGIRDIEFLVQCLQRLHGSRENSVKDRGTLPALARLHDRDLLSTTEFSRLTHAYEFLRKLEHVLQFENDRQVHAVPTDLIEVDRIARRISTVHKAEPDLLASAQLLKQLKLHLAIVQGIYERIVHAQRPLQYSSPAVVNGNWKAPAKDSVLPHAVLDEQLLHELENAAPQLAKRIRAFGVRNAKSGLADFLGALLDRPAELAALASHRQVTAWTLQLFELSPLLAGQLVRSPELLSLVRKAADHPGRRYAFEGLAAPLNDIEGLRQFFRREMFRIQVGSVCIPQPVFQTLDQTSALAEFVIARAYRIALEQALAHARNHATPGKPFEEPQREMMVVALGRLGMREFDLGSDADLLFIIPDVEITRQRFWTRVAERLLEILSAYTEGGPILTIDTRLRPNGREGILVQSESKYVEYFSTKAEAWEGIAYMKARAVAGDTDRATKFLTELQRVDWRQYGQSGRSKHDLRQMRMRLQREQGPVTPLKAAQGGYYDADFILMYLRLRGAGMFFKSLNTPERIDIVEKMGHLERSDAEFLLEAITYFRALDHALRFVVGHAEGRIPQSPEQRRMIAELMNRWTARNSDENSLEPDLLALQMEMRRLFETVFTHLN
ncbi:MAG: glutamine-synthetase adenylyltransferase [Acidobacteriota bacterium]|nr:glutamine-synthetase adenylyltransferase [Acidobacteriota bacterium]